MVAPAAAHAPPTLVQRRPASALLPYVSAYTGYRMDAGPPSTHQGVPGAHLTFLLCLDGAVELLRLPDPARSPATFVAMVGGLHDRPAVIAQGAPQTGLQLRLTWRGARALLGLPAGELAADVVDLTALLGPRVATVLDQLATTPTWDERFALLDRVLGRLAATGPGERGVQPEVGYAWDRLEESGGTLHIADLAREVGWSRRHLAEKFSREIGLAPKSAARLIRFEQACDRLRHPDRPPLAQVAAEAGYVDQSHLSRDFRTLADMTATQWLAERPDMIPANPR